jgi:hypothetical protein
MQEPRGSRTRRGYFRYGSAVALGLATAGAPVGQGAPEALQGSGVAPGAGAAEASDEWCDTDPLLLIETPQKHTVLVYYMTGVQTPLQVGLALLGLLTVSYTAVPAQGGGTQVTVNVLVPNGLLGTRYPARLTVSSQAMGTGTVYGRDTGLTGEALTVQFHLSTP